MNSAIFQWITQIFSNKLPLIINSQKDKRAESSQDLENLPHFGNFGNSNSNSILKDQEIINDNIFDE